MGTKPLRASESEKSIGVLLTGAIVVSTIIGSGIFLLPSTLAPLGKNALIAWIISGIGSGDYMGEHWLASFALLALLT
jgi:hypothetical protein